MIQVASYTNYLDWEILKEAAAIRRVNQFLADPTAKDLWLQQKCTEDAGKTPKEIWDLLCQDTTIELRMYSKWWSKVIGYFVGGDLIWTNRKYFDGFTVDEVASNDIHEYAHLKGFSHLGALGTSIPYTLNRVYEAWAHSAAGQSGSSS